jgi:uncharacterized protein (TIGR02271 family)
MQTVIGTFDDRTRARQAVDRLVQSGFERDDVHIQDQQGGATPSGQGHQMVGGQQADLQNVSNTWDQNKANRESKGDSFFARLFGMDDEVDNRQASQQGMYAQHAHTYDEAVRRGSAVVVVDAQDESQADRACSLLQECGAYDVNERSKQWQAEGWKPPVASGTQQQNLGAGSRREDALTGLEEGSMDVVEEQLQVGKREVDRGGVRVIQRVSSKPVRELVRLREEHAVVDRRPVDRPATGEDLSNFKEGTLEVHERSEEAVVGKTARVVEEVRVSKEVRDREETIEDTVRRKDVDVERMAANNPRERAVAADKNTDPLTGNRTPLTGKAKPPL